MDLPTLAITAAASAAAAYACSKIWAPGTLGAAATMPVLVALLKEAFARPTYAVARAVPVRGVVRSASAPHEPGAPPEVVERVPQQGEVLGSSRAAPRHAWKAAVVTGLLGFVIAAVIVTVPEFVAGSSAAGGDRQTTFFGGGDDDDDDDASEQTTTTTPDGTRTVPPASTVTVPPASTVTVPPADTTTVPSPEPEPEPPPRNQTTPVPQPAPEDEEP